jgi:FkbM family methyltransferase
MNVLKNCRHGLMLYNTNDVYIGRSLNDYGEFSEEEAEIFAELVKPGMTVLDVGANIGTHTVVFSKLVGPKGLVFAYEPQRLIYYSLCANISLNNLKNVYCLQNAVGNKDGRVDIPELDMRKVQNFGELQLGVHYSNAKSSCSVKLVKLDSLIWLERIDFIKIDIEGMEPEAILGAKEIINKHRPLLYLEADRQENLSLLVKMLRGLNYDIHFHSPLLYSPNNYDNNDFNAFTNLCSINMLCNPIEKPLTLDLDKFRLTELHADGKVVLKTTEQNIKQVYDSAIKDVTTSCLKAAHYYSDKLFEHSRALAFTEFALRTNPHDVDSYHYAAQVFCRMYNYNEALKLLDAALEETETSAIMFTRASVLGGLGRHEEAIKQYRKAIEIDPKNPDLHFNMACSMLATGNYKEGWEEYDWRFKLLGPRQFFKVLPDLPFWDGQPLNGRKLLLFAEQGHGDVLQFIRYIKYIDGDFAIACQKGIVTLINGYKGVKRVIPFSSDDDSRIPGEEFDCMYSLLSLPKLFNNVEPLTQYITPVDNNWEAPCKFNKNEFKIGIAWAGNEMHENDHGRSCYLREFNDLQDIHGVKFYSLQKGNFNRVWLTEGRVNLVKGADKFKLEDYTSKFNDLNDTANFIKNLDLVITVDTSIAHLAASMGKPTWVLLGFYSDYRWLMNKETSPWYPTARLFRHPVGEKNWKFVMKNVKDALLEKIKLGKI